MSLFEKLCGCPSIPDENEKLTALIRNEFKPFGCEEATDAMGSVFFCKEHAQGKHLMLCAGLDVGGVVATFVEGSKIYVGALGKSDVMQTAFSKVVFERAAGIFVAPDGYSAGTAVSDCYVETYDKDAADKIKSGDRGYFESEISCLENGVYWGYGVGEKYALYTAVTAACRLFDENNKELLEKHGIGKVTAAFFAQSSLMSRGAATVCYGKNPDEVILFSAKKASGAITHKDKYAVKLHDKAFSADAALSQSICQYFEENEIPFKITVESDADTALASISRAFSCPACANICIPVFHNRVITR